MPAASVLPATMFRTPPTMAALRSPFQSNSCQRATTVTPKLLAREAHAIVGQIVAKLGVDILDEPPPKLRGLLKAQGNAVGRSCITDQCWCPQTTRYTKVQNLGTLPEGCIAFPLLLNRTGLKSREASALRPANMAAV